MCIMALSGDSEILLMDGIVFYPYKYESEKELENFAFEHISDIFSKDSYLLSKSKIKTAYGMGGIPDGFVIDLKNKKWYVVEVELSRHNVYRHILGQVAKFYDSIENEKTITYLADKFHRILKEEHILEKYIKDESYKYIMDIVKQRPEIVIIIDEDIQELYKAINNLKMRVRVVVFKTYYRYGVKDVVDKIHIHRFNLINSIEPPNNVVEKLVEDIKEKYKLSANDIEKLKEILKSIYGICKTSPEHLEKLGDIYGWALENGFKITLKHLKKGDERITVSIQYEKKGKKYPLIIIPWGGAQEVKKGNEHKVKIRKSIWNKKGIPRKEIEKIAEKLNLKHPQPLSSFLDEIDIEHFKRTLMEFRDLIDKWI